MESPLERIAALASTLKEAELRCLLELTRRADEIQPIRCSSRHLAESTGLSRPNVQRAIDSLTERGLITTDGGSATLASGYRLSYLETAVLPGRGSFTEPPPAKKAREGGFVTEPQVALFQSQGGTVTEPGAASQHSQGGFTIEPPILRARESIDSDSDFDRTIDRLLKASPKKYDEGKLMLARQWLHGYAAKFGRLPNPHPPDDEIVAQFVSIAEWPRLEGMLYDLMAERKEPGASYAWFVTVALQRIHGITPKQLRERRAELKLVTNGAGQPDRANRVGNLPAQIAAYAAGKAMR